MTLPAKRYRQRVGGEIRLLEAVLLKAIEDLHSPSPHIREDARRFLLNEGNWIVRVLLATSCPIRISAEDLERLCKTESDHHIEAVTHSLLEELLVHGVIDDTTHRRLASLASAQATTEAYKILTEYAAINRARITMLIENGGLDPSLLPEGLLDEGGSPWDVVAAIDILIEGVCNE